MAHTVGSELESARVTLARAEVETHILDAQLIMAHVLNVPKVKVIAHPEMELTDVQHAHFAELVSQRAQRRPLAYTIGHWEFYGLDFDIRPGVLVPRPETEVLVAEVIERLRNRVPAVIADIGAGSGAICVALAVNLPDSQVYATEVAPEALQATQRNVAKHALEARVTLLRGDLVTPLAGTGELFDAIVSNPPYIPSADIAALQPEVRDYEPRLALDGGPDGLDAYHRIFPESIGLLREDGIVAVEIGQGEAQDIAQIAEEAGFGRTEVIRDLAGIERVVVAYR